MSEDKVTLRDVYDAVNRLEDKFSKRMDDVEEDVDGLKNNQNRAFGVLAVMSLFFSAIAGWVWNKLTGQGA